MLRIPIARLPLGLVPSWRRWRSCLQVGLRAWRRCLQVSPRLSVEPPTCVRVNDAVKVFVALKLLPFSLSYLLTARNISVFLLGSCQVLVMQSFAFSFRLLTVFARCVSLQTHCVCVMSRVLQTKRQNGWSVQSICKRWDLCWSATLPWTIAGYTWVENHGACMWRWDGRKDRSCGMKRVRENLCLRLTIVLGAQRCAILNLVVETWIPWPIELCDVSSGYVACPLLIFLRHAWTGVVAQASWFFRTVLWSIRCPGSLSRFQSSACCAVHVAWVCFQ